METQRRRKNAGVFAGGGEGVPLFLDSKKEGHMLCFRSVSVSGH